MTERSDFNVVWIMTDEQRADALGCYGSAWARSPHIDRLAQTGVRFAHAYTPSPLCVPARTIMLTGQRPQRHGVWSNAELGTALESNLIERFRDAGYATASFGKSHYSCYQQSPFFEVEREHLYSAAVQPEGYCKGYAEADYGAVKYPSPYTSWILAGRFPEAAEQTSEWQATSDALQWLRQRRRGADNPRPFLLRVSYNGPHTPVTPVAEFLDLIDPELIDIPDGELWDRSAWPVWYARYIHEYQRSDRLSRGQIRTIRHHYYAQCAFVDSQVGRLMRYLQESGLAQTTIVAFCSDHGTHLGDYGLVQKQTFFEPVVRVPLIVSVPGLRHTTVNAGCTLQTPVSIARLVPTLLSLCGLNSDCDYAPLSVALQRGSEPPAEAVVSEYTLGSIARWGLECPDRLRMVREGPWKLCYSLDNRAAGLLYNLQQDPLEQRNRFDEPECSEVIDALMHAGRAADDIKRGWRE